MSDFLHTTLLGKRVHRLGLSTSYGLDEAGLRWGLEQGLGYVFWTRGTAGASTRPLQEALKRSPETTFVATGPTMAYFPRQLRTWCDKALKELGVEQVDLLQVFWLGKTSRWTEDVVAELVKLRDSGKCRGIGASIHDRPLAAKLGQDSPLDVLMLRYNASHPGAREEIFPTLKPEKAVVAYTTTRWGGLLKTPKGWDGRAATAAECYRYALSDPKVNLVLTAPASQEQLEQNLKGLEAGPLTQDEGDFMRQLGAAVKAQGGITERFAWGSM